MITVAFCVRFSVISWLPSNTGCHSKISIYPILHHLTVTEDKLPSRKHCHCKAGDGCRRAIKNQVAIRGCLAFGSIHGTQVCRSRGGLPHTPISRPKTLRWLLLFLCPEITYGAHATPQSHSQVLGEILRGRTCVVRPRSQGVCGKTDSKGLQRKREGVQDRPWEKEEHKSQK